METWMIATLVIAFIILLLILGVGFYASSSSDSSGGSSSDSSDTAGPVPTITSAVATYAASTTVINVIGTNFLDTSTWKISKYSGTITYETTTTCQITISATNVTGSLTISNGSSHSVSYTVTSSTNQPDATATGPLRITGTTSVVTGTTANYTYYIFNTPTNAQVQVQSTITSSQNFGIICVGGGGGGSGGGAAVNSYGGGGGGSLNVSGISASAGQYFSITIGSAASGGTANNPGAAGATTTVSYYSSASAVISNFVATGGTGGSYKTAAPGGTGSLSAAVNCTKEEYGVGGAGGCNSAGASATYSGPSSTSTAQFCNIPSELISVPGFAVNYGGSGGGLAGVMGSTAGGGGGGSPAGGTTTNTGGAVGIYPSIAPNSPPNPAVYYGGGGGAGATYTIPGQIQPIYSGSPGGDGYIGIVIMYIQTPSS